jgi:hypothetical protein
LPTMSNRSRQRLSLVFVIAAAVALLASEVSS